MSYDQLLLEFLGDEAKKPEAAAPADQEPAAESQDQKEPKTRARRVSKLSESLKSLPTVVREIIHPDVLAAPEDFRLLGEETSERLHVEHGVLFDWHKSRANTCLDEILIGKDGEPSFNGHLQSDGLRAYRTFIERHAKLQITPVSCLTHITRKFKEARDEHPRIAARILLLTGRIGCGTKKLS